MDPLTPAGIALVFVAIVVSTVMDGNSFAPLIGPSSIVMVFIGCIGAAAAGFRIPDMAEMPKAMIKAFTGAPPEPDAVVTQLMNFAESARREGILALEQGIKEVDDAFMRAGLQMVVDGVEGDVVRDVLETELEGVEARHGMTTKIFEKLAEYAPAMGMLGTIIGLVNMLGNLSDADALGKGMALAMLTTLYGSFLANVIFLPIAEKLKRLHAMEMAAYELTLEGIMAVREGASPRLLVEKLEARLAPSMRIGAKARMEAA